MAMHYVAWHRQNGRQASQRFAYDPRKKAGGSFIRFAWPHAYRGQPDAYAIKNAAPRIIRQQRLAHHFLCAVRRERCEMEVIRNDFGEGRAENRDGRSKHHTRRYLRGADCFKQLPCAV